MPSTRTLEKPFGKPGLRGTLTEFPRCTRLTAGNTWPFTRPAVAGMESPQERPNRRRKATTFLRSLTQIRNLRKKATEYVDDIQLTRAGVNGRLSMFHEPTDSGSWKILTGRVPSVDCS